MAEDIDKDLEGLAGDLENLEDAEGGLDLDTSEFDLGGESAAAGSDEDAADAGGEDLDLSGLDLGSGEEGGEEGAAGAENAAEAGGESVDLDDDLQSMLDESRTPAAGGDESGGFEGEAPGGGGAPPPRPAAAPAPSGPSLPSLSQDQQVNLEFLLDIKLHVTFEVGRSKMLISDLLTLGQGSVIELHRLVGDELDLLVNGRLVAKGEVVVVNEKFGCKITDIIPPEDRVKHLGGL